MPKKNSPARTVGRRRTPAPAPFQAIEGASPAAEAAVPALEPTEPAQRRNPAQVVAEIMLAGLLTRPEPNLEHLRPPGAIVVVRVPDVAWVEPARLAWAREVSYDLTQQVAARSGFRGTVINTFAISATEQPSKYDMDRHSERFADVVSRGRTVIGFTPDLAWLPPDLVSAMDDGIVLGPPTPLALSETARRLTGSDATFDMSLEEAAHATPRLLRLAVRPGQDADAYLLKLRRLVVREMAATPHAPARQPTLRDEPTLERIHGMDEAVAWGFRLRDDLDAYRQGGLAWKDVDRGLLLGGPPGTGKTLFARALATSCRVTLVTGSYGCWAASGSGYQGDLLKALRKAFRDAKAAAPSILFIDEVDSFADRSRVRHYPEWHVEVVNTLLAELDGVEAREGVVVVAACNRPERLDPALVRSGRLDRRIDVGKPSPAALASILREHLEGELPGEDLGAVGQLLLGATGADVERLVRGARRRARVAGRGLAMADVLAEAGGDEARSAEDLRRAAVHEAGHVVAAVELGLGFEGVTLRGAVGGDGLTRVRGGPRQLASGDVHDCLVAHLSGRAAEEVILHRVTSGAGGPAGCDLQRATMLALQSAAEFGLEEDQGLTWLPVPDQAADLSAMLAHDPRLSRLVRARLASAYGSALNIVGRRQDAVRAIADRLLAKGALGTAEVCRILGARGGEP